MTREEVERIVVEVVSRSLELEPGAFTMDDSFVDDIGAASIDLITLAFNLEDAFEYTISDEDWERIGSSRDIVAFVCERLERRVGD